MRFLILIFFPFLLLASYNDFKEKFVKHNSYTIDPYNNNRVTSESQGYTLLLAVKNNDKVLFDNVWKWTKNNMQRKDFLFSWEWKGKVIDYNNATDGDLLITYALIKGYEKWQNIKYLKEAMKILSSLRKLILNISNKDYLLLPSHNWFANDNYILIYPSYYIPFVFKKFYSVSFDEIWRKLYKYAYLNIFSIKNISTKIYYNLVDKKFNKGMYSDMDVYRLIPYILLDKSNISILKYTFKNVDNFFKKNKYIPLRLNFDNNNSKESAPYCVYEWFYLLYKNKNYLKKAKELIKYDKNNYFCEAIDNLIGEIK